MSQLTPQDRILFPGYDQSPRFAEGAAMPEVPINLYPVDVYGRWVWQGIGYKPERPELMVYYAPLNRPPYNGKPAWQMWDAEKKAAVNAFPVMTWEHIPVDATYQVTGPQQAPPEPAGLPNFAAWVRFGGVEPGDSGKPEWIAELHTSLEDGAPRYAIPVQDGLVTLEGHAIARIPLDTIDLFTAWLANRETDMAKGKALAAERGVVYSHPYLIMPGDIVDIAIGQLKDLKAQNKRELKAARKAENQRRTEEGKTKAQARLACNVDGN